MDMSVCEACLFFASSRVLLNVLTFYRGATLDQKSTFQVAAGLDQLTDMFEPMLITANVMHFLCI